MEFSHGQVKRKNFQSESLLGNLGKRPILLVVITAIVSFSISAIPLDTIQAPLRLITRAVSSQDTSKVLRQSISAPSLLFIVVCLVILLIIFNSRSDGGEKGGFKTDDQKFEGKHSMEDVNTNKTVSKSSALIDSIFLHDRSNPPLSGVADRHLGSPYDTVDQDKDVPGKTRLAQDPNEEERDESFIKVEADEILEDDFRSSPVQTAGKHGILKPSLESVGFGKEKKLSRPFTSHELLANDHLRTLLDSKMTDSPCSFKEDPSQEEKDDLNERFDAFLENFRHELRLQKMESISRRQKGEGSAGQNDVEPTMNKTLYTLENDVIEEENEEELCAEELNEQVDKFVSDFRESFAFRQQEANPYAQQPHSSSEDRLSATGDTAKISSQLSRRDSLAVDNQKFDAFLQNFRNELNLQKQQSLLRRQSR